MKESFFSRSFLFLGWSHINIILIWANLCLRLQVTRIVLHRDGRIARTPRAAEDWTIWRFSEPWLGYVALAEASWRLWRCSNQGPRVVVKILWVFSGHICKCEKMCMYICICNYACMYGDIYIIYFYICIYICNYVCMYLNTYIYIWLIYIIYIFLHIHV